MYETFDKLILWLKLTILLNIHLFFRIDAVGKDFPTTMGIVGVLEVMGDRSVILSYKVK